jgi:hypothetical protein
VTVYTLDELRDVNEAAWGRAVRDAWDVYLSADTLEAASALDSLDGFGYCPEGCPVGSADDEFDLLDDCEHR